MLWPLLIHMDTDIHNGGKAVSPKIYTEGPQVSPTPTSLHEQVLHTLVKTHLK